MSQDCTLMSVEVRQVVGVVSKHLLYSKANIKVTARPAYLDKLQCM